MDSKKVYNRQRISRAEKEKNKKQWYKDRIQELDTFSSRSLLGDSKNSDYYRMKVNYDLFNNILDEEDFKYVTKPFGENGGELPARLVNRDILSNKIKSVLGMEQRRGFEYRVYAVNSDATTRREQEEFGKIREYVVNSIMLPIQQQIEMETQQELEGQELSAQQQQEVQAQVAERMKAMTPEEVKLYMEREYQDPAEAMNSQLLSFLILKTKAKRKFTNGFKHVALGAKEIYWVGENNGHPDFKVCNLLGFNHDKSPDIEYIEEGEWATYESRMTFSEIVAFFGDELTNSEIDELYETINTGSGVNMTDAAFDFSRNNKDGEVSLEQERNTARVFHATWRALRQVKFLTYQDEEGELQEIIVDETYELNEMIGDVSLEVRWIPEVYEGYKINNDMFKRMRPIPGQFRDMDNLYNTPLPYRGAVYDATNSIPTSLMDRGKIWQYLINILYYRLELLVASDKGKKVLMNINAVPTSSEIDIKEFQYFFESTPFGWFNPNEEGLGYNDVNTIAKVLDLSLASDIEKYITLIQTIKLECGTAMGITPQMEGQIAPYEAVGNTQQNLVQNSYIMEGMFSLHNIVRTNVLSGLLEVAKVCYSDKPTRLLSYVLDDMSIMTLKLDTALLNNSTIGLFIDDGGKTQEIKDMITALAQSAVQNNQAKVADIIAILKQDSISVAEDILRKSGKELEETIQQAQRQEQESNERIEQAKQEHEQAKWEHEKEIVVLKETERRETVLLQAAITGYSFNPETDVDQDGVPDFLELAKHGLNADIQKKKLQIEKDKLAYKKEFDNKKLNLEAKKLSQQQKTLK